MAKLIAFMACSIMALAPAAPAMAKPQVGSFIAFGPPADAPAGFVEMCERDPLACGLAPGVSLPENKAADEACGFGLAALDALPEFDCARQPRLSWSTAAITAPGASLSPALPRSRRNEAVGTAGSDYRLVRKVNSAVNRRVYQATDRALFGVDEYWSAAGEGRDAAGDCEDIALQKRAELLAAGFSEDKLFLAVVYKTGVGLHTVLVARLARGDVVLDSLAVRLVRWDRSRYAWLRLQVPGQPLTWTRPAIS